MIMTVQIVFLFLQVLKLECFNNYMLILGVCEGLGYCMVWRISFGVFVTLLYRTCENSKRVMVLGD